MAGADSGIAAAGDDRGAVGSLGGGSPGDSPVPSGADPLEQLGNPARRSKRVREIGIRTALGATSGAVVGQVVRHAETLTLMGAAIGLLGAYTSSRLIASMLFGVSALDPLTYGAVTALMAGVALLAAWAPARRAVGVDPTIALRTE